jgi:hypothetical protein
VADTRLFRITYDSGTVKFGLRSVAGPAAARTVKYGGYSWRLGLVNRIEATNYGATAGWSDVSAEFGITSC